MCAARQRGLRRSASCSLLDLLAHLHADAACYCITSLVRAHACFSTCCHLRCFHSPCHHTVAVNENAMHFDSSVLEEKNPRRITYSMVTLASKCRVLISNGLNLSALCAEKEIQTAKWLKTARHTPSTGCISTVRAR